MDCIVKESGEQGGRRSHAVHRLISRRVDGLVFLEDSPQETGGLPVVSVGLRNPSGVSVSIDLEGTASILKAFAGERGIRYKAGERALFPGLGKNLQQEGKESKGTLWVYDEACPKEEQTPPLGPGDDIVICGSRREAFYSGFWVLEFPAFEMGVLAARILVNSLRNRGVRPQAVSVVPSLFSPEGELFHLS
jgi:LacI family transcriptional regulator